MTYQELQSPSPLHSGPMNEARRFEGDWLVFAATLCLVIVTGGLVYATFKLNRTTKQHVKHSRDLVDIWAKTLELDRIARLAISVLNSDGQEPYIHLQNVGRVPIMIYELVIDLVPSQKGTGNFHDTPAEARSQWILPSRTLNIRLQELSGIWSTARYKKALIACTFHHGYETTREEDKSTKVTSTWEFDHNEKIILWDAGGSEDGR